MDNKGDYKYGVIVMLILGIIIFGILVFYEKSFADIAEDEMDWETCRLSLIGTQVSTKIPLKESYLACPRQDHIFEKETSNKVNTIITGDVDHTIRTMGGGGMDFSKGNTFTSSKDCIVFATYRFKDGELKKEFAGNPLIFIDWLNENYIAPEKTYFSYFEDMKIKFNEDKIKLNLLYDQVIRPDKTYFLYVVKMDEGSGKYFSWLATALDTISGGHAKIADARAYWQRTFFPNTAKESFSEEEIEKMLKTTRIVFADGVMLKTDCDKVYSPKTKTFEEKWQEEYKREGFLFL